MEDTTKFSRREQHHPLISILLKKPLIGIFLLLISISVLAKSGLANHQDDEVELNVVYITTDDYATFTQQVPVTEKYYLIKNGVKYFVGRTYDDLIAFAAGAYDSGLDSDVNRTTIYYISEVEEGEAVFVYNKSSEHSFFK